MSRMCFSTKMNAETNKIQSPAQTGFYGEYDYSEKEQETTNSSQAYSLSEKPNLPKTGETASPLLGASGIFFVLVVLLLVSRVTGKGGTA